MAKNKDTNTTEIEQEVVSRAPRASRTTNKKTYDRANFRRPNDLSIPAELVEYGAANGVFYYWVSVVDPKTKTFTNAKINHRSVLGGELVTAKEIKDIDPSFLSGLTKYKYEEEWADDENERNAMEGVRKGDLVLMKLPIEYKEFRQEENRRLVEEQLATAQHEYKNKDDAFVKEFKHGSSKLKLKKGFFKD